MTNNLNCRVPGTSTSFQLNQSASLNFRPFSSDHIIRKVGNSKCIFLKILGILLNSQRFQMTLVNMMLHSVVGGVGLLGCLDVDERRGGRCLINDENECSSVL